MSNRRALALMMLAAGLAGWAARAHAEPDPAPPPAPWCGSRFATARAELIAASNDAHRVRDAEQLEAAANRVHLRVFASLARRIEASSRAAQGAATTAALETLIGHAPTHWPANGGAPPTCG